MGIVALVLGVLLLVWPDMSILAASVLLGFASVASSIAQVILAFGLELSSGYRVLWSITGALSLILGVLAFRHFDQGSAVLLLAIWIGVGFIFRGWPQRRSRSATRSCPAGAGPSSSASPA